MNIIKQLSWRDISPATKNGELKYNDIFLVKNDDGKECIHMFINNRKYSVVEMDYDESLYYKLKQVTWTVEPNGTTIKSNSDSKTIRLTNLLKDCKCNHIK